jgi:hypothetical protein
MAGRRDCAGLVTASLVGAFGALVIWASSAIHIGGYHIFFLGIMAIGIVVVALAVFIVGLSFRAAFSGSLSTYLYDQAIVAVSGRTTDVIRWSQIDRLVVATSRSGKPTRYIVIAVDGRRVRINPKPPGRGDDVADRVVSAVRQLGRPIIVGGPEADDTF